RVRRDPARRPDARARRLRDRRVHQAPGAHPLDPDHLRDGDLQGAAPRLPRLRGGRGRLRLQALRPDRPALQGRGLHRALAGRAIPALLSFAMARPQSAEPALLVHVEDLRERKRAERARELLIREQAARLEAEAVTERLQGIQRIVDAALAPLALDKLLGELL